MQDENAITADLVSNTGRYSIIDLPDKERFIEYFNTTFMLEIERIYGGDVRKNVERDGVRNIHKYIQNDAQLRDLRDSVMRALRPYVFALSLDIGDMLGLTDPYWVADLTILRINYPFKLARLAPQDSLFPGSGTRDKPAPRSLHSLIPAVVACDSFRGFPARGGL